MINWMRRLGTAGAPGGKAGADSPSVYRDTGRLVGIAFDVAALTFNGVWQYARRHRLLSAELDPAGATAIGRRFQLAVAWLTTGAVVGAVLPVLAVILIAAFNAF